MKFCTSTLPLRPNVIALLLCCAVIAPQALHAQEAEISTAQQAFDLGMKDYAAKDYKKAIAKFEQGYKLQPETMFLYNIALSYLKMGDYRQAHTFAERAQLAQDLPARAQASNAARFSALGTRMRTVNLAEAARASIAARELAERQKREALEASLQRPAPPEPETGPDVLTYVAGGTAVIGIGLVAGALYLGNDVQQGIDALAALDERAQYDAQRASLESDQQLGQILLFSGIGLAAIGSGYLIYDLLGEDAAEGPQITLQPDFGPTPGARATLNW